MRFLNLALFAAAYVFSRNYIKVSPNAVAVLSGRKRKLPDGRVVAVEAVVGRLLLVGDLGAVGRPGRVVGAESVTELLDVMRRPYDDQPGRDCRRRLANAVGRRLVLPHLLLAHVAQPPAGHRGDPRRHALRARAGGGAVLHRRQAGPGGVG